MFLPCCESPVNRFLSVFVGNMLPLTPWLQQDTHSLRLTSCGIYSSNKLPLSPPGVIIINHCLSFLQSAGHVTSFVLHMHTVSFHATVFLSFCSGLRPSPSFLPVDCPPPQSEGGTVGGGGEREARKRERVKGEPNRM